jgi:cell division FtsZ-interacting protein ZapD
MEPIDVVKNTDVRTPLQKEREKQKNQIRLFLDKPKQK